MELMGSQCSLCRPQPPPFQAQQRSLGRLGKQLALTFLLA
jgi:hypothetical protein